MSNLGVNRRAIISVMMSCVVLFSKAASADPSDGEVLKRTANLGGMVLTGLFEMVSKDKLVGQVKEVKVKRSIENTVQFDVTLAGFENSTVSLHVADHQGKQINWVGKKKVKVPSPHDQASHPFELSLMPNADDTNGLQSNMLVVTISKAGKAHIPARVVSFSMPKSWQHTVAPENIRVSFKPLPIGGTKNEVENAKRGLQTVYSAVVAPKPVKKVLVETARRKPLPKITHINQPMGFKTVRVDAQAVPRVSDRSQLQVVSAARTSKTAKVSDKNSAVISSLPQLANTRPILKVDPATFTKYQPQQTPESTDPTNQVSQNAVQWHDAITESSVSVDLREVLGIYNIYGDSNDNSGVYYFVPTNYAVTYDRDYAGPEGLGLRISYDRAQNGGSTEDNSIRVAMKMVSGLDQKGIDIAQRILHKLARGDRNFKFERLLPIPTGGPVDFDFSTGLMQIVDKDDIAVLSYSDVLEDISVSWSSDELDAEMIRTNLEDPAIGIPGEVIFPLPSEDGDIGEVIPARIDLAEPRNYRALEWSDDGVVKNQSPLPVLVKRLHMLDVDHGLGSRVYSWDMGDTNLPAYATLSLDLAELPTSMLAKAEKVWFEYKLATDCGDCLSTVVDQIVIANVVQEISELSLHPIDPFTCLDAFAVHIDTRSRFFDASSREIQSGNSIYLNKEASNSEKVTLGSAFVSDRLDPNSGNEWPYFEYRLTVILASGEELVGSQWAAHTSGSTLYLGEHQIKQAFPDRQCVNAEAPDAE